MARHPRPPDEILNKRDMALQLRLSMMSQTAVEDFYRSAHMVCRIGPGISLREGDPGAGAGMETDEEVALSSSVRHSSNRTNYAGLDLGDRGERLPDLGFFFPSLTFAQRAL